MDAGEIPTIRHAARVVLLDETGRVLLARFVYRGSAWCPAPGGGLENTETHEEAARREIGEETGYFAGSGGGRSPSWKQRQRRWHRQTCPRW